MGLERGGGGEGDLNFECLRYKHQEVPVELQSFWQLINQRFKAAD